MNYPLEYAFDTWGQNDAHGTFPNGGGYDDADPLLMDDWRVIGWRYGLIHRQVSKAKDTQKLLDGLLDDEDAAPDNDALFRG